MEITKKDSFITKISKKKKIVIIFIFILIFICIVKSCDSNKIKKMTSDQFATIFVSNEDKAEKNIRENHLK